MTKSELQDYYNINNLCFNEYIELYRKKLFYDEKDEKQFEIYKRHIINKLKEIYNS